MLVLWSSRVVRKSLLFELESAVSWYKEIDPSQKSLNEVLIAFWRFYKVFGPNCRRYASLLNKTDFILFSDSIESDSCT